MRLTRAGIGLLAVGFACLVIGRLLGALELFLLAAMCGAALIMAAVYLLAAKLDVSVNRRADPLRLRAGGPARIDLRISNRARRSTPIITAQDTIQGAKSSALMLASIKSGDETQISYRLPNSRRGLLPVGPLRLNFGDPMGLTKSSVRAVGMAELVVHAQVIDLLPVTADSGFDPSADQQPARSLANSGNEFFGLRPYVVGDELRRVNWRASARSEDLVVRQDERPYTGRVTVALDQFAGAYSGGGFERAVSAVLSVLYAGFKGGDSLRFVTTTSLHPYDIDSRAQLDAADEQLAVIETNKTNLLAKAVDEWAKSSRSGTLILVTGKADQHTSAIIELARKSFSTILLIATESVDQSCGWAIVHDGRHDLAAQWAGAIHTL